MTAVLISSGSNLSLAEENLFPASGRKSCSIGRLDPKYLENEISFICHIDILKSHLDLSKISNARIEQRYFPKKRIDDVWEYISKDRSLNLRDMDADMFSQARIRREIQRGGANDENYEIAVKTPKEGQYRTLRAEIGREIDRSRYRQFMKEAEAGFVGKERYRMSVRTDAGDIVKLEIDIIRAAGVDDRFREYSSRDWEYAHIGCEVKNDRAIKHLVQGKHSIDFLNESTCLLNADKDLTSLLSMRYIAERGLRMNKIRGLLADAA